MRRRMLTILFCFPLLSMPTMAQESDHQELIEMIVSLMGDADKDIRAIAFDEIRGNKVPGGQATQRFADELMKLPPAGQIGLLSALADRGDAAAKPTILRILDQVPDHEVQAASIAAIGKLGDARDIPRLIEFFSGENEVTKKAARQSLIQLRAAGASAAMVEGINQSPVAVRVQLIDLLTQRRALDTIPTLIEFSQGPNAAIRAAAMKSLGQLAEPQHIAAMTTAVLKAVDGRERVDAEKQLMFVCQRISDKNKRAEPLLAAIRQLNPADKTRMIPTLGRVGGQAALEEIERAIQSSDASVHSAGIQAISNWPDASVANRLIQIAKSDPHADHQGIARRTLLRMAPLPDGRTHDEKLELLKTGMKLAANEKERSYGLKRAAAIRAVETLRYVLPFVADPQLGQQACQTVVELAHDRQLRDDNKPEFHAALDQVIATAKDSVLIERANRYKKGQTWVRPK